mgnify:CR=1 FL=1
MARGITVKVAKDKVVKALSDKLDKNVIIVADNEAKRKAHAEAITVYAKTVAKDVLSSLEVESVNTRWNNEVTVTYKNPDRIELPKQPEIELEQELGRYEVQEIENAIRILQMSDEEFVSASTMKQIAQYL